MPTSLRLAVVLLFLVPAAGCFRAELGECAVQCGGALGTACPSGLSCDEVEGFCQADPAADTCQGGPGVDGGDIDGGEDLDGGGDGSDAGPEPTARWLDLSAGGRTACAVRDDHRLFCWGRGSDGQLGNGAKQHAARATEVAGGYSDWLDVDVDIGHGCGLRGATLPGSLWCWGYNNIGEFFPGGPSEALEPVEVTGGPAAWKQISVGLAHTCGIDADDQAWCWGYNIYGQTGQGGMPSTALGFGKISSDTYTAISAGHYHGCAIRSDQTLWCWGGPQDQDGVLGLGMGAGDRTAPAQVGSDADWVAIGAFEVHTCGIRETGGQRNLWCWGRNSGQLGDGGTSTTQYTLKKISNFTDWLAVVGDGRVTCGIRDEGGARRRWCWGLNAEGSLGTGDRVDRYVPFQGPESDAWAQLVAGDDFACGRREDGAVFCWGDDTAGEVGDGHPSLEAEPVQVGVAAGLTTGWQRPVANAFNTCALNGSDLYCWGLNHRGQLAVARDTLGESAVPRKIPGDWKQVAIAADHACAIDASDALACWGGNESGQLGRGFDDNFMDYPTPEPVVAPAGGWLKLSASNQSTCAIHASGSLYCWGANHFEQLGQGDTTVYEPMPKLVTMMTTWTDIAVQATSACGITGAAGANDVYCWGENDVGELGRGAASDPDGTPMPVLSSDSNWVNVDGSGFTVTAVQADGDVFSWGRNGAGQVGNNSVADALAPAKPFGTSKWKASASGFSSSCAVRDDSTLWCWGLAEYGQLADGDPHFDIFAMPKLADPATDWAEVTVGDEHACATKLDGSLWCWGRNTYGQLGNGESARVTPRRIVDPL